MCATDGVIEGPYVSLSGDGIGLTLQRVMEAKTVKNRMHLDLLVADVEAEVRSARLLGATRLSPTAHEEFGQTWYVLADPEGQRVLPRHDPSSG